MIASAHPPCLLVKTAPVLQQDRCSANPEKTKEIEILVYFSNIIKFKLVYGGFGDTRLPGIYHAWGKSSSSTSMQSTMLI